MWPRNDGTFVNPHGQQVPHELIKQLGAIPSSSDVARVKSGGLSILLLVIWFRFHKFIDFQIIQTNIR